MAKAMNHAVESARPLIEAQNHKLTVVLPTKRIFLDADPTRLEQVLVNLLNNAAKYTKHAGFITLTAERQGEEIVIRVRDNGLGIAAEMVPKIFDLFTQIEQNLDRSQGGLGIGLTLVKKLVEIHGGRVAAYSEGTDKGSEFVVRLPVLPKVRNEAKAPAQASSKTQSKLRILVVEDTEDVALSLKMLLELWGHEVQLASNGPAALAIFGALYQPDVALIDIGLPEMNGYDVGKATAHGAGRKQAVAHGRHGLWSGRGRTAVPRGGLRLRHRPSLSIWRS